MEAPARSSQVMIVVMARNRSLQAGERLPYLFLPSAPAGDVHRLRAGRGYASIVLLLHKTDCAPCRSYAEQLTALRSELQEWDAQIVAVFADSPANVTQWWTMLPGRSSAAVVAEADGQQCAAGLCGLQTPALLIADQWGVLYFARGAGPEHAFPAPAEVVEWARFMAIQCPECQAEAL